jgi:hypothetical protein
MGDIYDAVERRMSPTRLSDQGRSSLRFFVNRIAVKAGYIYPHDKEKAGWRITPECREYLRAVKWERRGLRRERAWHLRRPT